MKIAVMQPYFMPYIGYFQLINAVDKFIIYDDVNYIKQGWINRNNILLNGKSHLFSIPLKDASSFKKINEIEINEVLFIKWKEKFFKTLELAYKKAPNYDIVISILKKSFDNYNKINDLIYLSLVEICNYLGITTKIEKTSEIYHNTELSREERLIDICKKENAVTYINPIGGQELYTKDYFNKHDISLLFLKTGKIEYLQFDHDFVPWLSIIDILMFNSTEEISFMLNQYELL
jgi:hypothetical protein